MKIHHTYLYKVSEIKKFESTLRFYISKEENLSQGFIKYWCKKLNLCDLKLNFIRSNLKLDNGFAERFFTNVKICHGCGDCDPEVCKDCTTAWMFDPEKTPYCMWCCECNHYDEETYGYYIEDSY